jgi:hypothetical protein
MMGQSWRPDAEGLAWFQQNLRDIVDFAAADGVVPILASRGSLIDEDNLRNVSVAKHIGLELMAMNSIDMLWSFSQARSIIQAVSQEKQAIFVDIYGKVPQSLEFFEDHVHITPRGQIEIAQAFCDELSQADAIKQLYE